MEINNGTMNVESYETMSGGEDKENYDGYDGSCETVDKNDGDLAKFVNEFCQFETRGLDLIPSLKKTYYYNSLNACAIPDDDSYIDPCLQKIDFIIHSWLVDKLLHTSENIPILEELPRTLAEDIMAQLRNDLCAFQGLSKVLISVRAGHVYLLHMNGDEIKMPPNETSFFQQFPLFVDVAIKVQKAYPHMARRNSCQVLVAVEHVKFKVEDCGCTSHTPPDNNPCQRTYNTRMITAPYVEGQEMMFSREIPRYQGNSKDLR
ncbi:28780_t:CDS:2 [Dentiscutata erythropus]|uniref:28780_t:CDS:1 n=1 Tax=Dentiscutata erythropus TaxID=1348616 RepID=A0A9N8Z744_9GLOM|nr:28780_t:CDS:2 [Dentiscutata erythropus]